MMIVKFTGFLRYRVPAHFRSPGLSMKVDASGRPATGDIDQRTINSRRCRNNFPGFSVTANEAQVCLRYRGKSSVHLKVSTKQGQDESPASQCRCSLILPVRSSLSFHNSVSPKYDEARRAITSYSAHFRPMPAPDPRSSPLLIRYRSTIATSPSGLGWSRRQSSNDARSGSRHRPVTSPV